MTTKPGVIGICSLVILISRIVKVDFARNTRNTFFGSIKKAIFKPLGFSNSIQIGR